jgi:hypothetical protein
MKVFFGTISLFGALSLMAAVLVAQRSYQQRWNERPTLGVAAVSVVDAGSPTSGKLSIADSKR